MKNTIIFLFVFLGIRVLAQDVYVHDPVMARYDGKYYLFATGNGISMFSSPDMKNWKKENPVFGHPPEWAVKAVPGFKGHIWAPDISFRKGKFYLYYSVSTFGKNLSCIGLATNTTLDPSNKNYKWVDHGKVIESVPGRDLWNAIDPNLAYDSAQQPWLSFGSFWTGVKLVKLDSSLTALSEPQQWYSISKRSAEFGEAVEAPFIFHKGGYYYLFVSFDLCCRGKESTYKIIVGRSKDISGPYFDRLGKRLEDGGGTMVLQGDSRWAGVGHNAVYTFEGQDYLIFHAYDKTDNGKSKLRIEELTWTENWPSIKNK